MHPALMMLALHLALTTLGLLLIYRMISMQAVGYLLTLNLKGMFA